MILCASQTWLAEIRRRIRRIAPAIICALLTLLPTTDPTVLLNLTVRSWFAVADEEPSSEQDDESEQVDVANCVMPARRAQRRKPLQSNITAPFSPIPLRRHVGNADCRKPAATQKTPVLLGAGVHLHC